MIEMAVKEYLGRALQLDQLIHSKMEEVNQFRRLAESISTGCLEEHVSRSAPEEASYTKWVERIVEKEKELDADIDRLVSAKMEISGFIGRVRNPQWQCLLRSRYVMGKSWAQIAEEMDCSLRSVHRLHKKIIKNLEN